jgi:hypothetical protein
MKQTKCKIITKFLTYFSNIVTMPLITSENMDLKKFNIYIYIWRNKKTNIPLIRFYLFSFSTYKLNLKFIF